MERSFLEELKEEIEISSNNQWNNSNRPKIIKYLNIENLRAQVLSTEIKFMQKDANGNFDSNNIKIVTSEEKEMILNLMEENNYPLTARMYNFLLKSYINGKLEIEPKQPRRKL